LKGTFAPQNKNVATGGLQGSTEKKGVTKEAEIQTAYLRSNRIKRGENGCSPPSGVSSRYAGKAKGKLMRGKKKYRKVIGGSSKGSQ